ncbi:uncharacterized protein LOC114524659 [Dendronephthya gigantea]|uniref:uncharacterized protein LOC114524659 n=1 Tax=Dendronephthya gigantea TaxID=151771 RepID=UPI00106924C2|nr:uncharacterized protein LOC114524659 [Dendronephthya gigantea]
MISKGILTICGGVLIHLSLGTLYTFGNMSPYITSYLRYEESDTSVDSTMAMWILAVQVIGQGFFMTVGGAMHDKIGARLTCAIGGTILSFGVVMTYFSIQKSFVAVIFTYGLLFGIGIGISYAIPINCAMKWFPSHKGLITGIIVSGFGAGAFIFDQVQTAFINPNNLKANVTVGPNNEKYFNQPELLDNVPKVFILLGCVYATMNILGSFTLKKPQPEHQQPSVYSSLIRNSDDYEETQNDAIKDKRPLEMLKTREFWTLWFMFLINSESVQFISSLYKAYGQTFISNDRFLAIVGSFASVFNGLGRIFWGYLADRISFRRTMIIQCLLMAFLFMTLTLTEKAGKSLYFIWVCLMFGTFSGNFALFPIATVKTFGQKYFTVNYGLMFTSQIFSGVMGALLAQNLSDKLGWFGLFSLVAGFSVLCLFLTFSFDAKKPNGEDI